MKRHGNLFEQIVNLDNLLLAHYNARKGKTHYSEVQQVDKDPIHYCQQIQNMLINNNYIISEYRNKTITEPKERLIYILPYYPDRIIQHAILQIIGPIFERTFIHTSYAARKNKGLHEASYKLREYLQDTTNTQYFLKFDIKKFYPSIDHQILKEKISNKIKCKETLNILFHIIDSTDSGIPIGNYISQYFGNIYLNDFDHYLKEKLKCKYYIRYCDDGIILSKCKEWLIKIKSCIINNLNVIKLKLHSKTFIASTSVGVDFLGYIHFHQYNKLRKHIKLNMIREVNNPSHNHIQSLSSYYGWCTHANTKQLLQKYNILNRIKSYSV
jgi:retron-type reverse transcriptase